VLSIISNSLAKITVLVGFIRSGGLCVLLTNLTKITGLCQFIRSCRHCTILSSLTEITRRVKFICLVDIKKVYLLLYNIDKLYKSYQSC
jgi:hypothetical protein